MLAACTGGEQPAPGPTATATATASATPSASATATSTASATATASAPAPTAVGTPPAFGTAPAGSTPPPGYVQSCAAAYPWGQQVRAPFVCISEPLSGQRLVRGASLEVSGYAGGSFENNVVIEVHRVLASGAAAPEALVLTPLTYVATDAGMPGFWRTTLVLPASVPAGMLRVIARFDSPRDGSRVAEASVDITLD